MDHRVLLTEVADVLVRGERREGVCTRVINGVVVVIIGVVVVALVPIEAGLLQLFWHWRKSNTLGQVGKRIDQLSPLIFIVVERASITKFAFLAFEPVLAWDGFVVGVDCAESSFSEIFWERLKENINQ